MFCPLSAEFGDAAEEADEVGWGGCVVWPREERPLEPFMSSLGLVGVIVAPIPGPFDGSLHPPVVDCGATKAMTSGGRSTPGLGSTPAEGTNTLSPCRAGPGPAPMKFGPEGGGPSVDHEGRSSLIGIGVLTLILPGVEPEIGFPGWWWWGWRWTGWYWWLWWWWEEGLGW